MPQKQCARCTKTVYPTEELKCLDKVWHKGCFKCQVCNMTLNMKNYKGYDKLPYCNTHYPQTKFTAVADTPENRRIASNTKIQSNIKYHEEYEKQKGSKIQIADDPEMQRVRQNMNVISNVTYHGDLQKRQEMERARPAEQVEAGQVRSSNPGRIADYDPTEMHGGGGTPYSNRNSAGARQVYDSNVGKEAENSQGLSAIDARRRVSQGSVKNRVQRFSSSGDDEQHGSRSSGYNQRQSRSSRGYEDDGAASMDQPVRKVGSISDYDPMNDKYGSIIGQPQTHAPPPQAQPQYQPPPPQPQPPQQQAARSRGTVCVAMYDYSAADTDEVSFQEGDNIIHCNPIDAGWMEGTVERTGDRGMLPSNYVEQV